MNFAFYCRMQRMWLRKVKDVPPRTFEHWRMMGQVDDGSRMNREAHVRFCERLEVQLLSPIYHGTSV